MLAPNTNTEAMSSEDAVPRSFIWLAAIAVGVIVTNLFAPQILVGLIGPSFGMSAQQAGMVSTLTLSGYAIGLFLLVPLADLFENKRLIVFTLCGTVVASLCATIAQTPALLFASVFLLGASCSAIQMLVPLIASMASPQDRGRVIGEVMSGLMVGILLSRPAASFISDLWNWRGFYASSAGAVAILSITLTKRLPTLQPKNNLGYGKLVASYWTLLRDEPVLRVRAWTAALVMASFSAYWAVVALKLSSAPFEFSPKGVAIFALVGAAGAIAAPIAGWLGDRGYARLTLCASHALVVVSLLLAALSDFFESRVWAIVVLGAAAILLDIGLTGDQTIGRRAINLLQAEARGRLNGLFVGIFFIGGAIGTMAAALAWVQGGWFAVCAVAGFFGVLTLITDLATSTGSS
ncbi:MAG TPA: MFS transporter [Afipia sp.]